MSTFENKMYGRMEGPAGSSDEPRMVMTSFSDSYLGRLRQSVGSRLLLVPGMRVVVEDGAGRVLLQLRRDFGLWGLPGGVPDEGESAEEAAIRETEEETGIRVSDLEPFGFASDPAHEIWTYPNGDRCHYFTLLTASRHFALVGPVTDEEETAAVDWFGPHALPPLLPVMTRTLDAYRRFRDGRGFQFI